MSLRCHGVRQGRTNSSPVRGFVGPAANWKKSIPCFVFSNDAAYMLYCIILRLHRSVANARTLWLFHGPLMKASHWKACLPLGCKGSALEFTGFSNFPGIYQLRNVSNKRRETHRVGLSCAEQRITHRSHIGLICADARHSYPWITSEAGSGASINCMLCWEEGVGNILQSLQSTVRLTAFHFNELGGALSRGNYVQNYQVRFYNKISKETLLIWSVTQDLFANVIFVFNISSSSICKPLLRRFVLEWVEYTNLLVILPQLISFHMMAFHHHHRPAILGHVQADIIAPELLVSSIGPNL